MIEGIWGMVDQCQILSVECRMSSVKCRTSSVKCRVSNVEWWMSNVKCRISNVECRMSNEKNQIWHSKVKSQKSKVENRKSRIKKSAMLHMYISDVVFLFICFCVSICVGVNFFVFLSIFSLRWQIQIGNPGCLLWHAKHDGGSVWKPNNRDKEAGETLNRIFKDKDKDKHKDKDND